MKKQIFEIIDEMGVSKFTWLLYLVIGLLVVFDGYDNMIVAYTMPQIAKTWALTPIQSGSLASWGLLGLMFGSFFAGIISDKIGRKKTMIAFTIVFSCFSGFIYFAPNFETFIILRVLAGIGIGAVTPVTTTLVSEFVPSKHRGIFLTGLLAFFVIGWILAGVTSMVIIPLWGWRPLYLMGMIPVLYVALVAMVTPESAQWLVSKGREEEALKVIRKMEKTAKGSAGAWEPGSLEVPASPKVYGLRTFISRDYRYVTLNLWVLQFLIMVLTYGLSVWMPSLLVTQGYSVVKSYSFSVLQNVVAIFAVIICGAVSDKIGIRKNGLFAFAMTGVIAVSIGFTTSQWQILTLLTIVGFFLNYSAGNMQPLMAGSYPTEFRNTGIAWTQSIGRLGGVVGPLLIGLLMQLGFSFRAILISLSVPIIICLIIYYFFKGNARGK